MLEHAVTLFCCQFVMIFMLGLQSQFVRDSRIVFAAITSLCLGIIGWTTTGIVSSSYSQGMLSVVFFSFIFAGPCGIATSIWLHNKLNRKGV